MEDPEAGGESNVDETVESVDELEETEPRESLENQIQQYEMTIKKAFKAKNMNDEANALNELGIVYYKVGRYKEALNCHDRQLRLALLTQDKRLERRALCNLGCAAKNVKDYDRALDCFQKGLDMATSEGDKKAEGKLLNNMASAYESMADFENAKKYYELRLKLAKAAKDIVGETKCCASLGNVMHVSGDIRESIKYFERVVVCIKLRLSKYGRTQFGFSRRRKLFGVKQWRQSYRQHTLIIQFLNFKTTTATCYYTITRLLCAFSLVVDRDLLKDTHTDDVKSTSADLFVFFHAAQNSSINHLNFYCIKQIDYIFFVCVL